MPIIDLLRKKIATRGARGIIGLGKLFKIMDDNRTGTLDSEEFVKGLKEYKLGIEEEDIKQIFQAFDVDKSGQIDYNEFLRAVRVFKSI